MDNLDVHLPWKPDSPGEHFLLLPFNAHFYSEGFMSTMTNPTSSEFTLANHCVSSSEFFPHSNMCSHGNSMNHDKVSTANISSNESHLTPELILEMILMPPLALMMIADVHGSHSTQSRLSIVFNIPSLINFYCGTDTNMMHY
jgi:hypothetical protein